MLLTESSRQNLLLVVTVLALICFFSSFLLFVSAAYIKITIDSKMKLLETYNSDVLPGIFIFVGLVNLIQNVVVVIVAYKLMTIDMRDRLVPTMKYILIGGIVLVIFEVASAIASFVHISILDSEFGEGLNKAMNKYIEGDELKREMDSVQMIYSCCGDRSYVDWFRYQWIEPESLRTHGTSVKKYLHADGKYYSDDAPFSCCDPRSPRPCIHHHIHDNKRHHAYNVNVETTLYVAGCRGTLMSIYGHVLLTVGLIATIIACLKTTVLLLFRLLQTSLSKAQQRGDWEATNNGYIYKDDPEAEDEYIKINDQDEGYTSEMETTEGEESTAPEDGDTTGPDEGDITASEGGDTMDAEGGDMIDPGDEASTVLEDESVQDENENQRYARRKYWAANNRRTSRSFKRNRNVSCRTKDFHESERSRQLTDELCQRFLFPGNNKLDESFSEVAVDSHIVDNVRRHMSSRTSLITDDQRSMTSLPASVRRSGNKCRSNNNCHYLFTESSIMLGSSCDERSEGRPREVSALALTEASGTSGKRKYHGNDYSVQGANPRVSCSFEHSFDNRQFPGTSFHVENEEHHGLVSQTIHRKCARQDKGCTTGRTSPSSWSHCSTSTSSTKLSSTSSCSTYVSSPLSTSSEGSCEEALDTTTGESRDRSNSHLKNNLRCSFDERRGYITDQWLFNQSYLMDIDKEGNFNHGFKPVIGQGNLNQDYLTDIDQHEIFTHGYMPDIGQGNLNQDYLTDIGQQGHFDSMDNMDQVDFSPSNWADLNHREQCQGHQNVPNIRKDKHKFLPGRWQKIAKKLCHVTGSDQRFQTNEDFSQQDIEESGEDGRHFYGPSTVLYLSNKGYSKASDHKLDTGQSLVALKRHFSLEAPSKTSSCNDCMVKTLEDFIMDIDDETSPLDKLDDLDVSGITMRNSVHQSERNVKRLFLKELDQCGDVESTGTDFIGNITRTDASASTKVLYKSSNRNHVRAFRKQNNISHLSVFTKPVPAALAESACRSIRLAEPSSLPGVPDPFYVSNSYPALHPLTKNFIEDQYNTLHRKKDWNSGNCANCETATAGFGYFTGDKKPDAPEDDMPKEVIDCTNDNLLSRRVLISPFN